MKKQIPFFMLCIFTLVFQIGYGNDFENTPKMVIKGEASIFKPADEMIVLLAVNTVGENSEEALNENNRKMNQVIANLQGIGLEETDYQTGKVMIKPLYQKTGKDHVEDRSKMSHFEVMNSIKVKTQKIDLANRILSEAVKGGVNQIKEVSFNINNPQAYQAEVIQLATQHAFSDARALAAAAGVHMKRILNLSLDQWRPRAQAMPMYAKMSSESQESATPIEAGNIEIQAVVNVIFEIENQ